MLRRTKQIDAQLLGCRRRKRAAMRMVSRTFVVAATVRHARLPVDVLARDPERFDVHAVEHGSQMVAGWGNRAAAGCMLRIRSQCGLQEKTTQTHQDEDAGQP